MSTSNPHNSGNSKGNTAYIGAGGGGGGGTTNGNYITWAPSQGTWTFTFPVGTPVAAPEAKKENKEGCNCKKCKEYFPYAEPNQDDGTLICYACRHGY
jgi:hypothetical protein